MNSIWSFVKLVVSDIFQDNQNHWCGARFLIMSSGAELCYKYGMGACTAGEVAAGIAVLAAAYAGKDWVERR